jgi:riboflavin-specific deaminase-like protein
MNLNQQIERWLTSRKNSFNSDKRPFITLAYAQSLDGSITTRQGEALALSGSNSIQLTHQLRSLHDGILVGIETVLTDDPQLTVREWQGENPQPIVLDSLLRMPDTARLFHHPDKQCWILTICSPSKDMEDQAEIMTMEGNNGERVPLESALLVLLQKGIKSLMVEGGATVITAFLDAQLVDAVVLTIAPRFVGGYKAVSNLDNLTHDRLPRIDPLYTEKLSQDLIVWGDLHNGGE